MQKITSVKFFQIKVSLADISSIEVSLAEVFLALLVPLASLAQVKQGRGQPRKYTKQANFAIPSDICFLIDKFNMFIKNIDVPPA